jgi:putative intracellular protease/amidase
MVLTSHDKLGESGQSTGFWAEEFAAPYYHFLDAGAEVTLASPQGGQPPIDPNSTLTTAQTDATNRFFSDETAQKQLAASLVLSSVKADDYDAVFYPGGHGPLWDLTNDHDSIALVEQFTQQGKIVSAVCHAPAVLLHAKNSDGLPLVSGKAVTGFTNSEEAAVGLLEIVPFLLENALKEKGGLFESTDDWHSFTVQDGLLITGQNPASSEAVAQAVLHQLQK